MEQLDQLISMYGKLLLEEQQRRVGQGGNTSHYLATIDARIDLIQSFLGDLGILKLQLDKDQPAHENYVTIERLERDNPDWGINQ
tara:strand:- start:534 stop:788 length:255 start_codon:yes stop_codon:yes gene_type:complete